jgi:hypothetical protein
MNIIKIDNNTEIITNDTHEDIKYTNVNDLINYIETDNAIFQLERLRRKQKKTVSARKSILSMLFKSNELRYV